MTPDGAALFVANTGSNSVSVVDPLTAAGTPGEIDRVALTGEPAGIAITPDQPPVAAFTASPAPPGSPTAFNASTSSVTFGAVTAFEWDFGDGSPTVGPLSSPLADHVYAVPGTYTVTLTLTTSAGSTTTSTRRHTGHGLLRAGGAPTSATTHALIIHSALGALDADAYVVDALAGVQELASGADVFARTIATGAASNSVAFDPDALTGIVPRDPISGAGVVGTDVVPATVRFDTANDRSRSVAVEPGGARAWIATAPLGGVQSVDLATGALGPNVEWEDPDGCGGGALRSDGMQLIAVCPLPVAGIAITPDGSTLFASSCDSDHCYVLPMDLATSTTGPPIVLRPGSTAVAPPPATTPLVVTPDGSRLYATDRYTGRVWRIDLPSTIDVSSPPAPTSSVVSCPCPTTWP